MKNKLSKAMLGLICAGGIFAVSSSAQAWYGYGYGCGSCYKPAPCCQRYTTCYKVKCYRQYYRVKYTCPRPTCNPCGYRTWY